MDKNLSNNSKKKSKKRWSKQEKRKHKLQKPEVSQQRSKSQRFHQCAQNASHTRAVMIPQSISVVSIKTTSKSNLVSLEDSSFFYVKPLIILDLNGILCHRIRDKDGEIGNPYRDSIANIAMTPIISRPALPEFLKMLDDHFCLAVWTSAKAKTANKLLKVLFPDTIREKLLFVWSQSQCKSIRTNSNNTLFQKPLQSVFQKYPLWNESNTILVDDSPEKSVDRCNTLHPPSLNGKHRSSIIISDEENVRFQREFFVQLVQFFAEPKDADALAFHSFLKSHGSNHMGWESPLID